MIAVLKKIFSLAAFATAHNRSASKDHAKNTRTKEMTIPLISADRRILRDSASAHK